MQKHTPLPTAWNKRPLIERVPLPSALYLVEFERGSPTSMFPSTPFLGNLSSAAKCRWYLNVQRHSLDRGPTFRLHLGFRWAHAPCSPQNGPKFSHLAYPTSVCCKPLINSFWGVTSELHFAIPGFVPPLGTINTAGMFFFSGKKSSSVGVWQSGGNIPKFSTFSSLLRFGGHFEYGNISGSITLHLDSFPLHSRWHDPSGASDSTG